MEKGKRERMVNEHGLKRVNGIFVRSLNDAGRIVVELHDSKITCPMTDRPLHDLLKIIVMSKRDHVPKSHV